MSYDLSNSTANRKIMIAAAAIAAMNVKLATERNVTQLQLSPADAQRLLDHQYHNSVGHLFGDGGTEV